MPYGVEPCGVERAAVPIGGWTVSKKMLLRFATVLLLLSPASAQTYTLWQTGKQARCNERTMKMPVNLEQCQSAAKALGRPFKTVEFRTEENRKAAPICAVDARQGEEHVKYNAGGRVDSKWGGNSKGWVAVCEHIELGSGEQLPFAPPPSPSGAPEGRRGGAGLFTGVLIALSFLCGLPMACWLQRKKMQARAARRAREMDHQSMAAAAGSVASMPGGGMPMAQAQPVGGGMPMAMAQPVGGGMPMAMAEPAPVALAQQTVSVTCPPGSYPGDTIAVVMPDGQQMMLQIPQGVGAGSSFMVQAPKVPVVVAAAVSMGTPT